MAKKTFALLFYIVICLVIQNLCLSSSLASQLVQPKFVRLLFPLIKGTELDMLSAYINKPKLYSIGRETFVLAAELPDAVVAYRLGKSIQSKTKMPFVLAYDPGHPQSDFRWMQTKNSLKRVSTELKPKGYRASLSSHLLSFRTIQPLRNLSVPSIQSKLASKDDNSLAFFSRKCVPVAKCLSTISISNDLVRDKDQSSLSVVPGLRDLGQIFSLRKTFLFSVHAATSQLMLNPGLNLFELNFKISPLKADNPAGKLATHLVRPSSSSMLSNFGISKERVDELGQLDKSFSANVASFNAGSGGKIANPSQVGELDSFSIGKGIRSSKLIDDSVVTLSPSPYFSLADPGLVYIFVRVSDKSQLASLFKARKPQAFYRIKHNLYAQIAVHNSSRVGKRVLDTDLDAIAKLGLTPIPLSPGQVLAMVSSVG
jgi:hypothetical protein